MYNMYDIGIYIHYNNTRNAQKRVYVQRWVVGPTPFFVLDFGYISRLILLLYSLYIIAVRVRVRLREYIYNIRPTYIYIPIIYTNNNYILYLLF